MRVFLLNQFVPPAQPPTARLLGDLAEALRFAGHEVCCIGSGRSYGAARGIKRLLRDALAHGEIAWKVLTAGRCDWIVALSDPMALPMTARLLAALKGARLAHWAMDVYPQTAIALGAVKEGPHTKLVSWAMRFGYRGCDLLVALDDDMQTEIARFSGLSVEVLPPWPPEVVEEPLPKQPSAGRCWLYSGNLGRAHEFDTLLRAQQILEKRGADWELHFQGGGAARAAAESLAASLGLQRCRWSGYAAESQLLASLMAADVLIATQRPETRGLLWPSKLALMKHLNIPIAWVGPDQGAIAIWLARQDVPVGLFAPGDAAALADWLEMLPTTGFGCETAVIRERITADRKAGTEWWLRQLTSKRT